MNDKPKLIRNDKIKNFMILDKGCFVTDVNKCLIKMETIFGFVTGYRIVFLCVSAAPSVECCLHQNF